MAKVKQGNKPTKLVRKDSQKGGMPSGVGYRTFDKAGNSTNYASSKDAAGYNDTTQSRSDMSKGNHLYRADSAGNVITSASIAPTNKMNLPTPYTPTNIGNIVGANNQGLVGGSTGLVTDAKGTITTAPGAEDKYSNLFGIQNDYQNAANDLYSNRTSGADIQKQLEKETGYKQARRDVENYSSQLNTIVANRDAQILQQEGQGRGITEAIIGGQQAQINKEAAIAALPVQAQLASAQGNLELAQSHINTWGKILMDDANAEFKYKSDLYTSARDIASGIELKRIADLDTANNRKYQETQDLIKAKTDALNKALGQGAPQSVATAIKNATDMEGVSIAAGAYNGDILGRQIQQAQLNKINSEFKSQQDTAARQEEIKTLLSNADPVSTKTALTSFLGSGLVSAGTKGRISPTLGVLNAVDELATANLEGQFIGMGIGGQIKEGIKGWFNAKNPEATKNSQQIEAINLKVQQWASGASLTETQTAQVDRFTPRASDSDKTIREKTSGLYNFMLNQVETDLITEGIDVQFPQVNLFEMYDQYAKADKEQQKYMRDYVFNQNKQ